MDVVEDIAQVGRHWAGGGDGVGSGPDFDGAVAAGGSDELPRIRRPGGGYPGAARYEALMFHLALKRCCISSSMVAKMLGWVGSNRAGRTGGRMGDPASRVRPSRCRTPGCSPPRPGCWGMPAGRA